VVVLSESVIQLNGRVSALEDDSNGNGKKNGKNDR
jgi:hypothetical protein